ncbi:MAG: 16S rRNA (cytosine(1402)-N(4))-methyltransferase RsmH [Lachnospiraceae bacterium]|nr:16S rRNA (cytosine(1402)-N(4))-methyltransferase RsmH [Lachnospiraceae bacterium]
MEFKHTSVLLDETIDNLNIRPDGIYVDGTLGGGGHSEAILKRLTTGRLIGIDQDEDAIRAASARLSPFGDKLTVVRGNFEDMPAILDRLGIDKVDGILLDLGVSSYQLDEADRGFSYMHDAPLDMRMDRRGAVTAADIVNSYRQEDLTRILRLYGEEKFAGRIAARIAAVREERPITTTGELTEIIREAVPLKAQKTGGHPAKKTFQAIRIELNRELAVLEDSLDSFADRLTPGGRIAIITFHSLEDRIVKEAFRRFENPCTCPPSFPVCVCGKKPKGHVITRKPIAPSDEECEVNSRSRSAKLRVFEHE